MAYMKSYWQPAGGGISSGKTYTLDPGIILEAGSATVTPLTIKGASGQTANLLLVEDSSGIEKAHIDAGGYVHAVLGFTAGPNLYVRSNRGMYEASQTNNQVYPKFGAPVYFLSGDASDGSAEAFSFDTSTALVSAGDKLLSLKNATTEKFAVDKDGNISVFAMVGQATQAVTLGSGATTFAATANIITVTGDAGGNTLATITGALPGVYILIFTDANVTITDDDTHTADTISLSAAFASTANDTLTLVYDGTSFYEIGRSTN